MYNGSEISITPSAAPRSAAEVTESAKCEDAGKTWTGIQPSPESRKTCRVTNPGVWGNGMRLAMPLRGRQPPKSVISTATKPGARPPPFKAVQSRLTSPTSYAPPSLSL